MRQPILLVLAALQLCGARQPTFNIHEDILAYPQFEVVFAEDALSTHEAESLMQENTQAATYSADFSQPTYGAGDASDERSSRTGQPDKEYVVMNLAPYKYLCSIPLVEDSAFENSTETELAKAEEAREFDRAATSGWDLLHPLTEGCLYYGYGWWSYSFCRNREITQFHALPQRTSIQTPKRDPQTAQYVLGRVPTLPAKAHKRTHQDDEKRVPAELAVKGDQRYLVQKLEGGTVCDLTGRERTIEVQYHCAPGTKQDRIGWIKEVTICSYLMVVYTGRLCNDVAFLPPEQIEANPITCQLISDLEGGLVAPVKPGALVHQDSRRSEESSAATDPEWWKKKEIYVGDVVVGARNLLSQADEDGTPPAKLAPPRSSFGGSKAGSQLKRMQEAIEAQAEDKEAPAQRGGDTRGQDQGQEGEAPDRGEADVRSILRRLKEAFSPPPKQASQTVAEGKPKAEGGKTWHMPDEQLLDLELSPEVVKEMSEQIAKLAGPRGWKLEVVDVGDAGMRELRGWVDDPEEGEEGWEEDRDGSRERFKDEL